MSCQDAAARASVLRQGKYCDGIAEATVMSTTGPRQTLAVVPLATSNTDKGRRSNIHGGVCRSG